MSIELLRRTHSTSSAVGVSVPPPAPVFDPIYTTYALPRREVALASAAKTIQILIFIIPPSFTTKATIFEHRGINWTPNPIAVLPPAPSFQTGAIELYRLAIAKLHDDDTAQLLVRGNTFWVDFYAVPSSGVRPLSVKFYNKSISPVNVFVWDFGDGFTSSEKEPIHTYKYKGRYTVILTVGDSEHGRKSLTKFEYIVVGEPMTGDIQLTYDPAKGYGEIAVVERDLMRDPGVETAIFICLFTDQRANTDDPLSDNSGDLKGWWGDALNTDGSSDGSKLWLLLRMPLTTELISRMNEAIKAALQWLIVDKIMDSVSVSVQKSGASSVKIEIGLKRGSDETSYRYYYNFKDQLIGRE
jgi:phage gp46-like protein